MNFIEQSHKLAQDHFGIQTLRPAQIEVLQLLFEKNFVLATLPTGSGKTLLYAIPSLILAEGPVVVISPLISLMRDQMRRMEDARIPCVLFTSDQTEWERKKSHLDLWDPVTKIIFVSPERFVLASFFNKISKLCPSMVVIDEAHCVISWGHQFRPEYSEIGKYLSQLNPARVLALTATAAGVTRQEMSRRIFPESANVVQYVSQPIGKHIFIRSVRAFSVDEQREKLMQILQNTKSQKSIVYFSTRKLCEEFSMRIKKTKLNAVVYHAGLTKESRMGVETYIHNTQQKTVVCATVAFGLGVDIPDVTLVVVYGFPGNVEEFLQMVGRAGRHGQPSEGLLLWTGSDPVKRTYQFKEAFPTPTALLENTQKIANLLPKREWESQFVSRERIIQTLFFKMDPKKVSYKLEGFLGALRVCQIVEDATTNEDYYEITLAQNTSLSSVLMELPEMLTKRRKALEALKILTHAKLFEMRGAVFVIAVTKLADASELSAQTLNDIFSFYATQKSLSFVKINSEHAKLGIIVKHGFQMIKANLNKYIKARQHFSSSLQELKKLAEAPRCRLESSFEYFQVPSMQRPSNYCLQCDLCQKYTRM